MAGDWLNLSNTSEDAMHWNIPQVDELIRSKIPLLKRINKTCYHDGTNVAQGKNACHF